MAKNYRICTKCVMDTSDPLIVFDKEGRCNHCKFYDKMASESLFSKDEQEQRLKKIVERIRIDGKGKRYDCIVGVSGGIDSTYTAYLAKQIGLRPLAVHLDNGWNSELAVSNIEKTLKTLDIDLFTRVLDWEEFKDLQLSFLKASTPDSEIPTDHAIVATLYQVATRERLKYLIMGTNVQSEAIMARAWSQGYFDWRYIRKIQQRFGRKKIKDFPHFNLMQLGVYKHFHRIQEISLLHYFPYVKEDAKAFVKDKLGWVDYGGKHYESIYTRFYQGYILPNKFGFDKRRAHLSTLICSGQVSREIALKELEKDPYVTQQMKNDDKEYVIKKLGLSNSEFAEIMSSPPKTFWEYPSYSTAFFYKIYFFLRYNIYNRLRGKSILKLSKVRLGK